jgi:hypothetical protein
MGCRISHLEAMHRSPFVMEDDILLKDNWEEEFRIFEGQIPKYDELYLHSKGAAKACKEINKNWMRYWKDIPCGWAYVLTPTGREIKAKYILHTPLDLHFDVQISGFGYFQEAVAIKPTTARPFTQDNPSDSDTTGDKSNKKPRGNKKGRRKVSDEESELEFVSVEWE